MSTHATAETLSAYLDHQLPQAEAREIEVHLAGCGVCRSRCASMKSVVSSLRRLDRLAPPSTLEQLVARRISFEGEQKSLGDRIEGSLRAFERQSSVLALFAFVVAFAVIIILFAQALEQRRNARIPVVFQDPVAAGAVMESRDVAGRLLLRQDAIWLEDGVDPRLSRIVIVDSPLWTRLLSEHPELAELTSLDRPAVVRIDEEVLRIEKAVSGQ